MNQLGLLESIKSIAESPFTQFFQYRFAGIPRPEHQADVFYRKRHRSSLGNNGDGTGQNADEETEHCSLISRTRTMKGSLKRAQVPFAQPNTA